MDSSKRGRISKKEKIEKGGTCVGVYRTKEERWKKLVIERRNKKKGRRGRAKEDE